VIPQVSYVSETARLVRQHLEYKLYKWLKEKGRQAHRTLRQRPYENLVRHKYLLDIEKYVRLQSRLVKAKG
jgi:hypothetical protein